MENTRISKEDLVIDLQRVTKKLEKKTLKVLEYRKHGLYSSHVVSSCLGNGSWNSAINKAGLQVGRKTNISDSELIADLKRVIKKLKKKTLTGEEYDTHGEYSTGTIEKRLGNGSWNTALKRAGLDVGRKKNLSNSELIADLERVAKLLKRKSITGEEYNAYGKYSITTIEKHLGNGSWNIALKRAGLDVGYKTNISNSELIADLKRVARKLKKKTFTKVEYDAHGKYCAVTIVGNLGNRSWSTALKKAGLEEGHKTNISNLELIADLKRVARKLKKKTFTKVEYDAHGKYCAVTIVVKLGNGSWSTALKKAGLEEGRKMNIPNSELIADLRDVSYKIESKTVSRDKYSTHGKYSTGTIERHLGNGSWSQALIAAGLIPRITSESNLLELCSSQETARVAVILCKGDEMDLADVLSIVTDGALSRGAMLKLLRRPTLKKWLGEYQKVQVGLTEISEAALQLLPYAKDGLIKSILIDRIKEYIREELGARPSKARITKVLTLLKDQSLKLKEIA